jgi:hypothetical protein
LGATPVINRGPLATAIATGPALVAVAQGSAYVAAAVGCGSPWERLATAIPLVALAAVVLSVLWLIRAAGGTWQRHDEEPPELFTARLGIAGNIFCAAVLLAFHAPTYYFHGCD